MDQFYKMEKKECKLQQLRASHRVISLLVIILFLTCIEIKNLLSMLLNVYLFASAPDEFFNALGNALNLTQCGTGPTVNLH